jgi:hypothetical protein
MQNRNSPVCFNEHLSFVALHDTCSATHLMSPNFKRQTNKKKHLRVFINPGGFAKAIINHPAKKNLGYDADRNEGRLVKLLCAVFKKRTALIT